MFSPFSRHLSTSISLVCVKSLMSACLSSSSRLSQMRKIIKILNDAKRFTSQRKIFLISFPFFSIFFSSSFFSFFFLFDGLLCFLQESRSNFTLFCMPRCVVLQCRASEIRLEAPQTSLHTAEEGICRQQRSVQSNPQGRQWIKSEISAES